MNLRYERKYVINELQFENVIQMVKMHPAHFRTAYPDRIINNIYFDDPNFKAARENQDGEENRKKYRLRWYGEEWPAKAHLEVKRKYGLVGDKLIFNYPEGLNGQEPIKTIRNKVFDILSKNGERSEIGFVPQVYNQYHRSYFEDADKIRITVDRKLMAGTIPSSSSLNKIFKLPMHPIIMELKYDLSQEDRAAEIASYFPFRLNKNSKYLNSLYKTGILIEV